MTDHTPVTCTHKVANHQCGTYAKHTLDRCRCLPCIEAARKYNRDLRRRNAYGRSNLIAADEARAHVRHLQAAGMGWKRVARAAGLSPSILWKLLYGDASREMPPSKRIRKSTHEAIMSVEADLADGAVIDGLPSTRRLQGLVAIGWTHTFLAGELGVTISNLGPLIHGRCDTTVAKARAIKELYDRLAMTPAPPSPAATRSRRRAKQLGWASPLAWDDIDDPRERPNTKGDKGKAFDQVAVDLGVDGLLTRTQYASLKAPERTAVVRGWAASGRPLNQLAALSGWNVWKYSRTSEKSAA